MIASSSQPSAMLGRVLPMRPAGTQGYLQPVELKSRTIDEAHSHLALVRGGNEEPVTLGEEAIISLRVDPAPTLEAPLVFAGYGLSIPEVGHDDFKDLDARGKLCVIVGVENQSGAGPPDDRFCLAPNPDHDGFAASHVFDQLAGDGTAE